jgi:hypothetical protein
VLAHQHDIVAKALVERWKDFDAYLLTCRDLSLSGWRCYLSSLGDSRAVASGKIIAYAETKGVLTRLSRILEHDLPNIVNIDRVFVAAEMTAFLMFWLSSLKCPILNRPTPTSLSGPNWHQAQWVFAASKLGIPIHPFHIDTSKNLGKSESVTNFHPLTVTVVGRSCFGEADDTLKTYARGLAAAAGVNLLSVCFSSRESGSYFISADQMPDISSKEVSDAVLEYFDKGN